MAAAAAGPGLKDFLQRGKVLRTYRQFLRLAYRLPEDTRGEVVTQVRREFRASATAVDSYSQRAAMAEASRQLDILASYVSTAVTAGDGVAAAGAASAATSAGPGGVLVSHTGPADAAPPQEREEDEDYQGRKVGRGWPWARPAPSGAVGTGTDRHFRDLYPHRLPF